MSKDTKELFDIDKQFSNESQSDGYKSWDKFLSEDVVFGGDPLDPYTQGKKNIIKSLEEFYKLEDLDFSWEPKHAFISDDKTLGVTTGIYSRMFKQGYEIINRKGKYTTTWVKENGEWKIIFDIGN